MRKLLGIFLLTLFVSCSKYEQIGNEYILFEIHGTVTDVEGNPIEGIKVSGGTTTEVYTNLNGSLTLRGRTSPTEYVRLSFEDKDGESNGGKFLKRDVAIPVQQKLQGDENGNFKGKYFAQGVKVILVTKTSELNPDSGL